MISKKKMIGNKMSSSWIFISSVVTVFFVLEMRCDPMAAVISDNMTNMLKYRVNEIIISRLRRLCRVLYGETEIGQLTLQTYSKNLDKNSS
ncbi:hypothetical protein NPIL_420481 [Nephila pilipes]|uniref:Uncharacterized protein n=1 Tax=Nephila pilipes TaxID=299642 RepID=A0A8X6MJW3_NEPPI|nr:hypothetical protein NPIL_420481 [Nephila pilipes]